MSLMYQTADGGVGGGALLVRLAVARSVIQGNWTTLLLPYKADASVTASDHYELICHLLDWPPGECDWRTPRATGSTDDTAPVAGSAAATGQWLGLSASPTRSANGVR
jgi:hypothetical protein